MRYLEKKKKCAQPMAKFSGASERFILSSTELCSWFHSLQLVLAIGNEPENILLKKNCM